MTCRNRRPDWRRIKTLRSYTMDEVARLLQVHRNTVRYWIKDGLPVLANQRPHLIHGGDLAAFLKERRESKRQKCGPGEFFCLKCRHPRQPADGMVEYQPSTPARGIPVVGTGKRDATVSNYKPAALKTQATIRAELIGNDTATGLGVTARGNSPVLELCRLLIAAGHDASARLEAYRGNILCLKVRTIGAGAQLRTATHGVGFERLPDAQGPRTSRKTPKGMSDADHPAAGDCGPSCASTRPSGSVNVAGATRRGGDE